MHAYAGWFRKILGGAEPSGSPRTVRAFGEGDRPLTSDGVTTAESGWQITSHGERSVRLFEVADPGVERCMLTYRATMRTAEAEGAYLEMWCRFPGRGEFFSRGLHQIAKGTTDWASYEVPFRLKKGQRPDLLKLNVAFTGRGTAWVKDIAVLETPLR